MYLVVYEGVVVGVFVLGNFVFVMGKYVVDVVVVNVE